MARGAPKLLKTGGFFVFFRSAICRLDLGNDVHRSKQGDTTFEVLADLFASIGESKLFALAQRVTRIAVMVFEDICGQLIGTPARQVGFAVGSGGRRGRISSVRLTRLSRGRRMRAVRYRKRD